MNRLTDVRNSVALGLIAMCCGLLPGCRESKHEDSSHVHEEHFPAHWPVTIFVAADRLQALHADPKSGVSSASVSAEKQWVDLFRWLPELAADSDLTKSDFDRIDAISLKYAILFEKMLEQGQTIETMKSQAGVLDAIEMLQSICQTELRRLQSLQQ
jgi:hypothetical protein